MSDLIRCPVMACGARVDPATTSAGDLAAHLVKDHGWVGSVALAKARELLPPLEASLVVPRLEEYPDPPTLAGKEAKADQRRRLGRRTATAACTRCGHRVGTPHSKSCPRRGTPNDGACGFCRMAKGGKCKRHRDRAAKITKSLKVLPEPPPEPIEGQETAAPRTGDWPERRSGDRRRTIRRLQTEFELLERAHAPLNGAR